MSPVHLERGLLQAESEMAGALSSKDPKKLENLAPAVEDAAHAETLLVPDVTSSAAHCPQLLSMISDWTQAAIHG